MDLVMPRRMELVDFDLGLAAGNHLMQEGVNFKASTSNTNARKVSVRKRYGGFGNNFYQLTHAILIAQAIGAETVGIPDIPNIHPCGWSPSLGLSISLNDVLTSPVDGELSGVFYAPYGFERLFSAVDPALLSSTLRNVCNATLNRKILDERRGKEVVALHFRGGDLFGLNGSSFNWYVQPPASFYILALENALVTNAALTVDLVYEDRANPAVSAVEEYLLQNSIPFTSGAKSLVEDFGRLVSANVIIASYSTFVEAAALSSRSLSGYYSFRCISSQATLTPFVQTKIAEILEYRGVGLFVTDDISDDYTRPRSWVNSALQRDLITKFPKSRLRLYQASGERIRRTQPEGGVASSQNQVFIGHEVSELERLRRYVVPSSGHELGFHKDVFGTKTRLSLFSGVAENSIEMTQLPFPDNLLYGESVEYLGTLHGVEQARGKLNVFEFGAGFAPWLAVAYSFCRLRPDLKKICFTAVEADPERIALIKAHLDDNGIIESQQLHVRIENAAVSACPGTLYFAAQGLHDWGGSMKSSADQLDYRGLSNGGVAVDARTVEKLISEEERIDLAHFDIQGWEAESIQASLEAVNAKIKTMVIGTHSRVIEGRLIELLRPNWRLIYEKPCKFDCRSELTELVGATSFDGTQVWDNRHL